MVADSGAPEYLSWDASAAVARELELGTTPTLLTTQGCASAVTARQQIAGLMAVRDDIQRVLLVAVCTESRLDLAPGALFPAVS